MHAGKTLFAQLMEFVPWTSFARIVSRHDGDKGARTMRCTEQFRVMAFGQITSRESLRDTCACLGAQPAKLYSIGLRSAVARSTLAGANESRDWRVWSALAAVFIRKARRLYAHEPLPGDLAHTLSEHAVYALDSTTIDLYLILDLYSRKIVGWEVHERDDSDHAAHLVRRPALAEGIAALTHKPVLHGDNGSTLKATMVLAMLNWLGVKPSYSRPRVSDDNAYAESLFRTAKYRPEFPARGFTDLDAARAWAVGFVHWYNVEHRHSGIRYVSPAQRQAGDDRTILAARHALYLEARALNPARWTGNTRDWSHIGAVTLNPERDCIVKTHSQGLDKPRRDFSFSLRLLQ